MIQIRLNSKKVNYISQYHKESDIYEITINNPKPSIWKYGIDINGTIIFDLNEEFLLENIEILIPKRKWENFVGDFSIGKKIYINKAIEVSKKAIDRKSFYLKEGVRVFKRKTDFLVFFNNDLTFNYSIKLSKSIYALVNSNELIGFFVENGLNS